MHTSRKRNPVSAGQRHGAYIEADAAAIDKHDDSPADLSPQARWNTSNPKALWAHSALRSALRKGLIERGPCEVCGAVHGKDDVLIHGHHDDYDKPMQVRWLCMLHHRQIHAGKRADGGAA